MTGNPSGPMNLAEKPLRAVPASIQATARTGLSLRQLRPLRSATIQTNGAVQTLPPALGVDEQAL